MLRRISEELTRKEMIDPQLEKAGWYLRAVGYVWGGCSRGMVYGEVKEVVEFTNQMAI